MKTILSCLLSIRITGSGGDLHVDIPARTERCTMNSTTTLRACDTIPDVSPRSRRAIARRRVRFSTVAVEHTCEEQQQQQVSSISECIDVDTEQQHMRHDVESAWKMPSASGSSWSDRQALSLALTLHCQVVPASMRTRRAHQLSKAASSTVINPQSSAAKSAYLGGTRSASSIKLVADAAQHADFRGRARRTASSAGSSRHRANSGRSARLANSEERLGEAELIAAFAVPLLGTTRASALKTLLCLWQLHTEHNAEIIQEDAHRHRGTKSTVFANESARLLTATEEATLGSIVQQHRKLLQSYHEHLHGSFADSSSSNSSSSFSPAESSTSTSSGSAGRRRFSGSPPAVAAAAAAAAGSTYDSSNDSISSGDDVLTSSGSSSRKGKQKGGRKSKIGLHGEAVHGNTQWPPPLTQADLEEVAGMPRVWRALLPELGPKAQQLLMGYNTRLVAHMLQYCRRSLIPTEDLLAAGLLGLKVAAARYDPSRKTRFSTVASGWILQHMQRAADVQQGTFRTPHRHAQMLRAVLHSYGADALKDIEKRPAVLQRVADQFKTKPLTVLRSLRAVSSAAFAASLDAPSFGGPGSSRADEDSTLPLAAMVTSTDLDEDTDDGSNDGASTGLAGAGSYMAAAGQLPAWMQQQHAQVVTPANSAAAADAAAATEQQVEILLQVLPPRERAVMLMLYGNDTDDLGKIALEAAEKAAKRPGRPAKNKPAAAGGSTASKLKYERKDQEFVSLSTVAQLFGMSTEGLRQVRNAAFTKLRLAAEAMACSDSSSNGLDGLAVWPLATAVDAVQLATAACTYPAPRAAVAAAVQACPTRQRRLLWALQDYVAVHGVMPGYGVDHKGCHLGMWCSKLYFKHKKDQDSLSPELLHAMELVAPGWVDAMAQCQYGNRHAQ